MKVLEYKEFQDDNAGKYISYAKSINVKNSAILAFDFEQFFDLKCSDMLYSIEYHFQNNTMDLRYKYQKECFISIVKLYEFLLSCDKSSKIMIKD